VGQYFRNIAKRGNADPLVLLAARVIDQAVRDAREVNRLEENNRFQPGVITPPAVLKSEKRRLLAWLNSNSDNGFIFWARLAMLSEEDIDKRRDEIKRLATSKKKKAKKTAQSG